jgi:Skp family chaperone for outer membrane proteins
MVTARKSGKELQMKSRSYMTIIGFSLLGLISALLLSGPSLAADFKVGQISLPTLYKNSVRVKAAMEELKVMQMEAAPRMDALGEEIKKLEAELKKGKDALGEEQWKKLQADFKAKVEELQNERQNLRVKANFKQKSIQNVIKSQLEEAVAKIAKEEGLNVVFMKEALVYSEGLTDLTEKVTKALDAMPPLEKGPDGQ